MFKKIKQMLIFKEESIIILTFQNSNEKYLIKQQIQFMKKAMNKTLLKFQNKVK